MTIMGRAIQKYCGASPSTNNPNPMAALFALLPAKTTIAPRTATTPKPAPQPASELSAFKPEANIPTPIQRITTTRKSNLPPIPESLLTSHLRLLPSGDWFAIFGDGIQLWDREASLFVLSPKKDKTWTFRP